MTREQESQVAMWTHLGPLVLAAAAVLLSGGLLAAFGFLIPLILKNSYGSRSAWVHDNAVESLNFQLSQLIYSAGFLVIGVVVVVATFGLGAFILLPLLVAWVIAEIVVMILATIAATQGRRYRYPLTIRFVR